MPKITTRGVLVSVPHRTRLCILAPMALICLSATQPAWSQVKETIILNFDVTNGGDPFAPLLADNTARMGRFGPSMERPSMKRVICFGLNPVNPESSEWKFSELWMFQDSGIEPAVPE